MDDDMPDTYGSHFDPTREFIGKAPPDFPAELPIPEDANILAGLINNVTTNDMTVAYETELSPDELEAFYRERMAALGWSAPPPEEDSPHGGFQPMGNSAFARMPRSDEECRLLFCNGEVGPGLRIMGDRSADLGGITSVFMVLEHYTHPRQSPCAQRQQQPPQNLFEMLPMLYVPDGSNQSDGHCSGDATSVHCQSHVLTNLDHQRIIHHYHTQLVLAGWSLENENTHVKATEEPYHRLFGDIWRHESNWRFRDRAGQQWRGSFSMMGSPKETAPTSYTLELSAQMVD